MKMIPLVGKVLCVMGLCLFAGTTALAQCEKKETSECIETSRLIVGKIKSNRDSGPDEPIVLKATTDEDGNVTGLDVENPEITVTTDSDGEFVLLHADSIVVPIGLGVTYEVPVKTEPGILEKRITWTPEPVDPSPRNPHPEPPDCPEDEIKRIECSIGYITYLWQHDPSSEAVPLTWQRRVFPVQIYPKAGTFELTNTTEVEVPHCCPEPPYRIRQAVPVTVVEVDSLEPDVGFEVDDKDGDPDTKSFLYVPTEGEAYANVTATPNPKIPQEALPPEWEVTGGETVDRVTQRVPIGKAKAKVHRIVAVCGSSTKITTLYPIDLRLTKVTYDIPDKHQIKHDTSASDFTAPQWLDDNRDGDTNDASDRTYPICYTAGTKPTVFATILVDTLYPHLSSLKVTASAIGPDGIVFPSKPVVFDTAGLLYYPVTTSTNAFPAMVRYHNPLQLQWTVDIDGHPITNRFMTSRNKAYITLNDPNADPRYETVLYLSCKGADKTTNLPDAITGIFNLFKTLKLDRAYDGQEMKYWLTGTPPQSLKESLKDPTGDSSCAVFAVLFRETLEAQGVDLADITAVDVRSIYNNGVQRAVLIVKGLKLLKPYPAAIASLITPFTHEDASYLIIPAQGNKRPFIWTFDNHYIVRYKDTWYDPSYGLGPFGSPNDWENVALGGFAQQQWVRLPSAGKTKLNLFKANDPTQETIMTPATGLE